MYYQVLFLITMMITFVSSVRDRSISTSSGSCSHASQIFSSKVMGQGIDIPLAQVNGDQLNICRSKKSCCTPEIERNLQLKVKKEFVSIMQASTSNIKNTMATDTAKFQELFLNMIRLSENNTQALFAGIYQSMVEKTKKPIKDLYSSLTSYLRGRSNVELDDSVHNFFDELFPSVYHRLIDPKVTDMDSNFVDCLKTSRRKILPFGEVVDKISEHVKKSFRAAHTLLQALNLGIEVINTTDHSTFYAECTKHLTKLVYCPYCQLGLVGAKPCNGYCLNVVRGCLAIIADLDQPWNDYIAAMTSMTSQMRGAFSVEEALALLDDRISEAITHAVSRSANIQNQVDTRCKQNVPTTQETANKKETASRGGHSHHGRTTRSLSPNLFAKLEVFMKSLSKSKGLYATLADTICSDDNLSLNSNEQNCWNGNNIGEYTKMLVGVGIEAQKYNPEVKSRYTTDLTIARLKDKLVHIKYTLHSQIVSKPESDSFTVDAGSGAYQQSTWSLEDDEDYSLYSSGSGASDITIDETKDTSAETTYTKQKNSPIGGGATCPSYSYVHVLLCAVIVMSTRSIHVG